MAKINTPKYYHIDPDLQAGDKIIAQTAASPIHIKEARLDFINYYVEIIRVKDGHYMFSEFNWLVKDTPKNRLLYVHTI